MTYEPLHHKYRPQRFGDLVGQEAIATTLTNAILSRRIAPAYLFTGPRGTGKTSSARILAKSLNCLNSEVPTEQPCGNCSVCRGIELANGSALDVIEIDAASNTGVDNIRDLIEKAQFAPVQCRYKVYLIDEVHMLSQAAFNCLLKTLEEPPNQVVFVLATTDPQRVLPTIISRCQRFDFRRIPLDSMVKHLGNIAKKENIDIAPEALTLVAQVAQGGLRDAESLLDQLSLLPGQVTVDGVWDLVGAVPERDLMALLHAIANNNSVELIDITRRLMDRGREPLIVLQNLAGFYRDLLIAKSAPDRADLVACTEPTWHQLCEFSQNWEIPYILAGQKHLKDSEFQIKNTTQPRLWLEVTLLGLLPSAINRQVTVAPVQVQTVERVSHHIAKQQQSSVSQVSSQTQEKPTYQPEKPAEIPPPPVQPETPKPPIPDREIYAPQTNAEPIAVTEPPSGTDEIWQQVIENLQPFAAKALVSQHCQLLKCDENVAYIKVSTEPLFELAQRKLSNIEAAFLKVFNRKVKVKLEVGGASNSKTVGKSETRSQPKETFPPATILPSTSKQSNQTQLATPKPIEPLANSELNIADKEQKDEKASWYKPTAPVISHPSLPSPSVAAKVENPQPPSAIQVSELTEIDPESEDEDPEIDEVAIASQQLVDFFKGKVVKLTDELELLDPVSAAPTTTPAADFKPQYSDEATGEFELEETDDEPF